MNKTDEYKKLLQVKIDDYMKFLHKRNRSGLEILTNPNSVLYRIFNHAQNYLYLLRIEYCSV